MSIKSLFIYYWLKKKFLKFTKITLNNSLEHCPWLDMAVEITNFSACQGFWCSYIGTTSSKINWHCANVFSFLNVSCRDQHWWNRGFYKALSRKMRCNLEANEVDKAAKRLTPLLLSAAADSYWSIQKRNTFWHTLYLLLVAS